MFNVYLKIGSNKYLCQSKAKFNQEGNETLDSGEVVIKGLTTKLDIQPLDKVYLMVEEDDVATPRLNQPMRIKDYQCYIIRQTNPVKYGYTISLISETKTLEGIPLPNIVITNDSGFDIYTYISRYVEIYGSYLGLTLDETAFRSIKRNGVSVFFHDGILESEQHPCPNMQWNAPTLRELLNDLCMVGDCLVTVQENVIKPFDISVKGSEFDGNHINYEYESQELSDYTSELYTELVNCIDKQDSINIYNIGYRNDDYAYFNSVADETAGGFIVKTDRPIVDVKKFIVNIKID